MKTGQVGAEQREESGPRSERWLMLALIWFVYFCFGLTMASLAPLVTPIMEELALSDQQMGFILGTWQLVYIGTAYLLGSLVDRIGLRWSISTGIIIMGVSMVVRSLAGGFGALFLAVALFGFGGPLISTGTPKLVSIWFRGKERGLASGIYSTAPVAGTTAAMAVGGSLIIPYTGSWRGIGLVYGSVLFAALAAWLLFGKEGASEEERKTNTSGCADETSSDPAASPGDSSTGWAAFRKLLGIGNVRLIMMLALGTLLINHGLNNWLPTFLQEKGMTLSQAGLWSAAAVAVGVAGGLLIPGLTGPGRRPQALSAIFAVIAVAVAGLVFAQGLGIIAALLMAGFVRRAIMPLAHVLLMETPGVGSKRMGAATGMYFTFGEIGGFSGPFLLGVTRDISGSLSTGFLMMAGFALFISVVPLFVQTGEKQQGQHAVGGL